MLETVASSTIVAPAGESGTEKRGLQLRWIQYTTRDTTNETNGASVVPINRRGRQPLVPCQLETALPPQIALGARLLDPLTQGVFAAVEFGIGALDCFSKHHAATSRRGAGSKGAFEDHHVASGEGAGCRRRETSNPGADDDDVAGWTAAQCVAAAGADPTEGRRRLRIEWRKHLKGQRDHFPHGVPRPT